MATSLFPLQAFGGYTWRIALDAPAECLITRAAVVQLKPDGTKATADLDGFTYTLYDAAVACPPGQSLATTLEPTVKAVLEAQHEVLTRVVPAGQDRYLLPDGTDGSSLGPGLPYINADDVRRTAPVQKVYMKLVVEGTDRQEKTFGVFLNFGYYRG
jgi:hypothetical protein